MRRQIAAPTVRKLISEKIQTPDFFETRMYKIASKTK